MMSQTLLDFNFQALIVMVILIFHVIISLFIYVKARRWLLIFISFIFSIIIGVNSFQYPLPLQVELVFFDIFVNFIMFVYATFKAFKR